MKQYEAVIKVMEENGGFATLGFLNQEVLKVKGCEWRTKTPFASIRRIVQDGRHFFKIKPGLWALKTYRNRLPLNIFPGKEVPISKKDELNHAYFQGLLVEIGNLKKHDTFVPNQDKNKNYLDKKLGEIVTIKDFYKFSYDRFVHKAKTIDVSWFNERKMPDTLFEIEHSTDFQNSLLKFTELQDFNLKFFIVADEARKREYDSKLSLNAFSVIQNRVKFMSYDSVSDWHARTYEITSFEKGLDL